MEEDICLWPDGTMCYSEDLTWMLTFMSDDFERIAFDTPRWHELKEEM